MDRPEKWPPGDEKEEEEYEEYEEEEEEVAPLPDRIPRLRLIPLPAPRRVPARLADRLDRWESYQERRMWSPMRQGQAQRYEIQYLGSKPTIRRKIRNIVRRGDQLLLRNVIAGYVADHRDHEALAVAALRLMRDDFAIVYKLLYQVQLNQIDAPQGTVVWALDRLEYATHVTKVFYMDIRKNREVLLPGLRNAPKLFPQSTIEETLSWLTDEVPGKRMLEALLNALMILAWSGRVSVFTQTKEYSDVQELVKLFGTAEHEFALAAAASMARIARKKLAAGKRKLLKRTRGRRI